MAQKLKALVSKFDIMRLTLLWFEKNGPQRE